MESFEFRPIEEYIPRVAMVFYNCENSGDYVEVCKIEKGNITSTMPATIESLSFLKEIVVPRPETNQPIKLNSPMHKFLYFDNDVKDTLIVWESRAKKRVFEFKGKKVTYYCPKLLWVYRGHKDVSVYSVWKDELGNVLVPNIYDGGRICWGNVKMKRFKTSEQLFEVEELFWNSGFSSHLAQFKVKLDDLYQMDKKEQLMCHEIKTNLKEVTNGKLSYCR